MTRDDVLNLTAECSDLLRSRGVLPEYSANENEPFDVTRNSEAFLRHLMWACGRIPEVIDRVGGFQVCIQHLGCIQGGLAACGLLTIAHLRQRSGRTVLDREYYDA